MLMWMVLDANLQMPIEFSGYIEISPKDISM